jgi:hypothetical protein
MRRIRFSVDAYGHRGEGAVASVLTMRPHVVRQGEYLSKLAVQRGFNAEAAWNDGANDALRARRTSYDMLAPGDVVYLPDEASEPTSIGARTHNRYRGRVPRVPVEVACHVGDEPIANADCVVEGLARPLETRSDGDGVVRFEAPMHRDEVWLVFREPAARFRVMVGHLDPHDEESGALQRLVNLGYATDADLRGPSEVRAANLRVALLAFQRAHDLPRTGALDEATRNALRDEHGS